MTDNPPEFPVPEEVLDRLDDIAAVELDQPGALIAAVARLEETMGDHCEALGFQGDRIETMEKLMYEMHRRQDLRRYRAAMTALGVMEETRALVAAETAPFN